MSLMTPPVTPPNIAAQVREQVAQARHVASHAARNGAAHDAGGHDDHRDYVRHYLKYLSTQAVGRFAAALGQLAGGLDSLGRRTADSSARLARTEQDVLLLTAAIEDTRALPAKFQALEARLARAEARLGPIDRAMDNGVPVSPGHVQGGDDRFIAAVGRHLPSAPCAEAKGSVILGPLPDGWASTFEVAGYRMERAAADGSAHLMTGLCTLDGLAYPQAAFLLRDAQRALGPRGTLLVVAQAMPADGRPAGLARMQPRIAGAADIARLAREIGFSDVRAEALDAGWPAFGVVIASR
jgi:hypothetical protein